MYADLKVEKIKRGKSDQPLLLSHWDDWNPKEYLETYFVNLGKDSDENLSFLIKKLKKLNSNKKMKILDFGSGPTIFSGLAAAPYASEIHLSDYLSSNLQEINKWIRSDTDAFDWSTCTKKVLELEISQNSEIDVHNRENLLRSKVKKVFRSDASLNWPIFSESIERYPIVISNFCADSATSSKEIWRGYMKNIFNTVERNGMILLAALRNCEYYFSGKHRFPSANVNEIDLLKILKANEFTKIDIEVRDVEECQAEGFTSIMFASAIKQ